MFVLAFKTMDDREREVEFECSDEAIARMEDIPCHVLEYAHVHDEAVALIAER